MNNFQLGDPKKRGLIPKLRFPEFADAGEWEVKKLGNVATFHNGRAYKQEELLDKGKYRVLRVGNFFTNENWYYSDLELDENKYCDKGDLLYAWSASFAPKIWQGEKVIYHYHIWKVLQGESLDKQFLFIILERETEKMKNQSANGLGLLHITKGTIEAWKCHFPTLPEQQKIGDCLSSLDELITAETKKLDSLKAHKKGLMQQLFPAEGETVPKLRFPEFADAGEWEVKELKSIATIVMGSSPSSESYNSEAKGLPFMQGNADIKERLSAPRQFTNQITRECKVGDILLSVRAPVGTVAKSIHHACIGRGLAAVSTIPPIPQSYLYQWLLSFEFQWHKLSQGGTFDAVNSDDIRGLYVNIPQNTLEQQKIADCLSSLDELITAETKKLESLKTYKKGLMQGLFPSVEEVSG